MRALILAAVCALWAWPVGAAAQGWKEFSSAEGRFSALMPGDPQTGVVRTLTRGGVLNTYSVSSSEEDLSSYAVSWTDYRPETAERRATAETFDKIRDALLAASEGKLLGESSAPFEGNAARSFTYATPDGDVTKALVFFDGGRFYQVMAQTRGAQAGAESRERFLNSFRLLRSRLH